MVILTHFAYYLAWATQNGTAMSATSALIVDDSATARLMLCRVLESMDIQVKQANSGEQALRMLASELPDVIFLDHMMPGLDGFQTLKHLKASSLTATIPVFMYTSQNALKYHEEAKSLGAAGVITKQIERDKLYVMVERASIQRELDPAQTVNGDWSQPSLSGGPPKSTVTNIVPLRGKSAKHQHFVKEIHGLQGQIAELRKQLSESRQQMQQKQRRLLYGAIFFATLFGTYTLLHSAHQSQFIQNLEHQLLQSQQTLRELISAMGVE